MLRIFSAALISLALASCGEGTGSAEQQARQATPQSRRVTIQLTSAGVQDGQRIPSQYTCDGADLAPAITWSAPPAATKSFALIMDDPDAPGGTFRHWGVYDMPASARSVSAGARLGSVAANDFGKVGYGGPCPPKGDGPHHYRFRLFALDVDKLDVSAAATVADVEDAAAPHVIAQGELIGTYERR